jgi:hypothetical protein
MSPIEPIAALFPKSLPPTVTREVVKVIAKAVRMAVNSKHPTRPESWQRAFIAASSEFASEAVADRMAGRG